MTKVAEVGSSQLCEDLAPEEVGRIKIRRLSSKLSSVASNTLLENDSDHFDKEESVRKSQTVPA